MIHRGHNWQVHVGHVLSELRKLPDASVQCVVTSPPYFGLRAYGTEPQVWGGASDCAHEWSGQVKPGRSGGVKSEKVHVKGRDNFQIVPESHHAVCVRCSAWRGELGSEPTPQLFVAHLVEVFEEVRRVLRADGVLFCNMGDSYNGVGGQGKQDGGPIGPTAALGGVGGKRCAGFKMKDMLGIPWRLAFALQDAGWYLRQDILWVKKSPMPESVTDRCTKAHEYIFMLTKNSRYFCDMEAVKEPAVYAGTLQSFSTPKKNAGRGTGLTASGNEKAGAAPVLMDSGRNLRSVWTLPQENFPDAHFATFPSELPRRCIKMGTSERGCCPACGAPWRRITARTALKRERPNELTKRNGAAGTGNHCANTVAGVAVQTRGWEPGCGCEAGEPIPCTVLDPFSGSGTSGMAATELGRNYIGLELNPEYAAMSPKRIESWKVRDTVKALEPAEGQRELF